MTINGKVWEFMIGKGSAVIVSPITGKKNIVSLSKIHDGDLERGRRKKTSEGMVTPAEVKAYIEKNLV